MRVCEQGRVMPFAMSGARMRSSAREYRRRGQALEALSLVRRAAGQDDTAAAWQALAAELRQMSCWEVASVLLGRVLSRPDAAPSAWLDMARCMSATGSRETAEDCLYHLLHEAPWSPEGDAARSMLQAMEDEAEAEDSRRVRLLSQRAMKAWHAGERKLALRRLRRAVRLSRQKARLMTTVALLYMVDGQERRSIRCLTRAIRIAPRDALTLCSMAALQMQVNRRRVARGFLRMAEPLCNGPQLEERFCTTAWMLDAWPELTRFLQARLKRTPYRIPLLHARANMLNETGRTQEAQQVWRTILSVDPEDRTAVTLLSWTQTHPGQMTPPGRLPTQMLEMQRQLLEEAEDLFAWGSEARRALDWCAASKEPREQQLALAAAARHPDRQAETLWLRELLTRPDVQEILRQQALMRLAEMEHFETLNVLLAGRYVSAQCQPTKASPARRLWHMFLPALLRASAPYGRSSEIVAFAAELWPMMTPQERQEAAAVQSGSWSRMMLVMWLWQQGRSEEADREMSAVRMPLRRFRRLMNRFLITLENEAGDAGEGDT